MITNLINLLAIEKFYGVSENVEIAKGKYEIPYTWKQGLEKIKRIWYGRKNNY